MNNNEGVPIVVPKAQLAVSRDPCSVVSVDIHLSVVLVLWVPCPCTCVC